MARKRFSAEEKAIIAAAAEGPVKVEWQNVTQWHPGTLSTTEIVTEDGWQHITVHAGYKAGAWYSGQDVHATPGHLRRAG
jgi:hypothetical protein